MSNLKDCDKKNKEVVKTHDCSICGSKTHLLEDKQLKVTYSVCDNCGFFYKNIEFHLNKEEEHNEYNNHNNSFESLGYVKMFETFIKEHIEPLKVSGKVLEYGSGSGPVLKELLRRKGFEVFDFDPFYNSNKEYLKYKYNLITSTEVVEHFYYPLEEFKHLIALLSKNGYLVIMTSFNGLNEAEFLNWRYRREASHVSFFSVKTLRYIANELKLKIVSHNNKDVIVLQKQ